jgi:hypothetical protein
MTGKKKARTSPLADAYPHIAEMVLGGDWIELGYCYNTETYARALYEGGMLWGGGTADMTLEELLEALEEGIAESNLELGR